MYVGKSGVLIGGSEVLFYRLIVKVDDFGLYYEPENPCFPSLSAERTDRKEGVFLAG